MQPEAERHRVDRLFIEGWRVSSFGIFAALVALLAVRPRRAAGVWDIAR
ncbi:hypothetical protein AB0B94_06810 [Micromonospora sp. NPDC048986]